MEALMDTISKSLQATARSRVLTLGEFIGLLEQVNPESEVRMDFSYEGPGPLSSYRGFYDHLALTGLRDATVDEVLSDAKRAVGEVFSGYKGGDYTMSERTPLWWATHRSQCHDTGVIGVLDRDYQVIILTGYVEL